MNGLRGFEQRLLVIGGPVALDSSLIFSAGRSSANLSDCLTHFCSDLPYIFAFTGINY